MVGAVGTAWEELGSYDEENVDPFLALVVPLVLAGQRQSVALTNGYLARMLDRDPYPLDITVLTGAAVRNGAEPREVYRRPFVTAWAALRAGTAWEDAVKSGLERATSAAAMDVQMSMRATAAEVGRLDDGIVGWQRVADGGACPLCLIASTQRYHSADLMPIHNHCGCGVEPIVGVDVGQVINPERLAQLKEQGQVTRITEQRRAARARESGAPQVATHEHGELGPVLTQADHAFAGPSVVD